MKHGSLFSGIGGFDLAAQWMEWENVFHCELNPFGRKVLNYYWPNAKSYEDIKQTDFSIHSGEIDILTGGFPCQPFSSAGSRGGKQDDRYLWPEYLRAIREIQPTWVIGENVAGITSMGQPVGKTQMGSEELAEWVENSVLTEIIESIEEEGYNVQPFIIPAYAVQGQTRRDRIWIIGCLPNSSSVRFCIPNVTKEGYERAGWRAAQRFIEPLYRSGDKFSRADGSAVARSVDGLSERLDGITLDEWETESIKAYGNAIVPQVAYQIFKAIEETNFQIK